MSETRDDTFRKFGPLLLEACSWVLLDEINLLRTEQGMSPRSMQDIIDGINNHITELVPYDWMQLPES